MQLVVQSGSEPGRTYDLTATRKLAIGRQAGNDLIVLEEQVSRRHAEIEDHNGYLIVTDLKSSNGTLVNGALISAPQTLHAGDIVQVGSVILRAVDIQNDTAAMPSPPNYQTADYGAPGLNTNPTMNLAASAYTPPPASPDLYNNYNQPQPVQNYGQPANGYNQAPIPQNYPQADGVYNQAPVPQSYSQAGVYNQVPAPVVPQYYGQSAPSVPGGYGQPATGGVPVAPQYYGQPNSQPAPGGYGQPATGGAVGGVAQFYGQPAPGANGGYVQPIPGANGGYVQPIPAGYGQPVPGSAPGAIVPYKAAKRKFPVTIVAIGILLLVVAVALLLTLVVFKDSSTNGVADLPAPLNSTQLSGDNAALTSSFAGLKGDVSRVKTGLYASTDSKASVLSYYQLQLVSKGWTIDSYDNTTNPSLLQLSKDDQLALILIGTVTQQSDIDSIESKIPSAKGKVHINNTDVILLQMPKSLAPSTTP